MEILAEDSVLSLPASSIDLLADGFIFNNLASIIYITVNDSGSGSDGVSINISVIVTDEGTGAESVALSKNITVTDSGIGTDGLTIAKLLSVLDSGAGSEEIGAIIYKLITDSGLGSDSVTKYLGGQRISKITFSMKTGAITFDLK